MSVLLGAWSAPAQRISGEVRLQVLDNTGAALRVNGSIVGQATGVNRAFETDDQGKVTLRGLPLGRYELTLRSAGFAPKAELIEVQSELPFERRITLEISPLSTLVEVRADTLLDTVRTAQYLSPDAIDNRPGAAPSRSAIALVNTQPGWLVEANGVLHPRGSEYDVQYVVDGVPLYDNRSPAFAQSVNIEEFESLNVRTAGYPAEFGLKLGGVIETASEQTTRRGLHGGATLQESSFNSRSGFFSAQYDRGRSVIGVSGDAMITHRYLDPPVQQNYTNRGSGGGVSAAFQRQWSDADRTRIYAQWRDTKFMVPNEMLQQQAGQRQDRGAGEALGQASHTHLFSTRVLGQFRAMVRNTNSRLWSNPASTPIRPAQDRGFRETYLAGSLSAHYGNHELKAGGETWFSSIHEDLSFQIVAYRLGAVRIFDSEVPQNFRFSGRTPGRTQSAFMQDTWRMKDVSVSAGLRFDQYRLVQNETAWSPRLGVAYEVPKAGLVLRGSYDRVFQIPAMENILLASSDRVGDLGGEGLFLPLRPSRANFFEVGFSKSFSNRVRVDGTWYRRSFDNFADDSLLLNTGVSFPIAFSRAAVRGFETKIELRALGPFTGQVSYSNMIGFGRLPVAGGLLLGDEAEELREGEGLFPISQDQRNTFRSQLRYQPHPRVWFGFAASYNSGLPFEIEGPSNEEFTVQQYGGAILGRVNFDRGRVRPSASFDVSGGVDIVRTEKLRLRVQADGFNLTNRLNVINFSGVFSGTALDVPRSFAVRLRTDF
ncbi:MAG: TonB-dependent receptor [Acidobacteria bacterium]|nr:TonB-dependent receptor [Acidobacteriota bacterium]